MVKYYRRAYRRLRRSSARPTFRRRFAYRKRFNPKKALARRRAKPELKRIDGVQDEVLVYNQTNGSRFRRYFNPSAMTQGTGISQRVGNRIKTMRVSYEFWVWQVATSNGTYANFPFYRFRVMIFSPRVDQGILETYLINNLTVENYFDPNIMTVYYDKIWTLSNRYVNNPGTFTPTATNLAPAMIHKKGYITFPRNVQFRSDSDEYGVDHKDTVQIYLIFDDEGFLTAGNSVSVRWQTRWKLSYIDV